MLLDHLHLPERYLHDGTDLILLEGMRHVRVVHLPRRFGQEELLDRWDDCFAVGCGGGWMDAGAR